MSEGTYDRLTLHTQRHRAESFGGAADDYDRYRPTYPAALIDDLAALAPQTTLDVGCGTGKATRLLAARGLDVLGLELDPRMADVARGHGVMVEVGTFEDWDPGGRSFDLITAAQSWHWVDPARGVPKAAALLRSGGTLALFWNHMSYHDPAEAFFDEIYAAHAPELHAAAQRHRASAASYDAFADPLRLGGHFSHVEQRAYTRTERYSTDDWVGMISTHSDHLTLDEQTRAGLFAALRGALATAGGLVEVVVETHVVLARR